MENTVFACLQLMRRNQEVNRMGMEYFHVMLSLAAVISLMLVLVYFIKKFKLTRYAANKHVKVINIIPIGSKEKIILVQVKDSKLLLGVTANHIETLYVFNETDREEKASEFAEKMEAVIQGS